jgi:hypothetical protein
MKRLFLLFFISTALIAGKANAQTCDLSVTLDFTNSSYLASVNSLGTFTWHVTASGWLNYTLTDNGPGGPSSDYESNMDITYGYGFGSGPYSFQIINPGGGSFSGSLYIGTNTQYLYVTAGSGWISGAHSYYSAESWGDVLVSF